MQINVPNLIDGDEDNLVFLTLRNYKTFPLRFDHLFNDGLLLDNKQTEARVHADIIRQIEIGLMNGQLHTAMFKPEFMEYYTRYKENRNQNWY